MRGVDAVEAIARAVTRLSRYVSPGRAFHVLKEITLYHRIQGSPELYEAVERVEEYIIDSAPDNVETEIIGYTHKAAPSWMSLPVRWSPASAVVELQGRVYRLQDHPTLVAAHSPPSDGWVEGEVVEPEDPLDPDSYRDPSKIYLIRSDYGVAYRLAAEAGAAGVVVTRNTGRGVAVPYVGLFLDPDEAGRYTTPAVSLPWGEASQLPGKRIRFKVDVDVGGTARHPVLAAWIGDKSAPGPVIVAHICHPRPGANDNASGASSAVEAFIALAEALDEASLPWPGGALRLVLVPEYTGTVLSMEGWLGPLAAAAVNLDMVGGSEESGTGPAQILYPPLTAPEHRLSDTLYWASEPGRLGLGLSEYMFGSDHDVFLAYGREGVMVNQWPDPYYHSDMDDASRIDPARLRSAALAAASAAYAYATGVEPPATAAGRIVEGLVSKHAARGDRLAARLAGYYAARAYGVEPLSRPPLEWRPEGGERVLELREARLIFTLSRTMGLEGMVKLARLLRGERDLPRDAVYGDLVYAASRGMSLAAYLTLVAAAYGVRAAEAAGRVVEGLAEMGIIGLRG